MTVQGQASAPSPVSEAGPEKGDLEAAPARDKPKRAGTLRTMLKASPSKPYNTTSASQIYKEEGISGFFKGVFPALILVSNPILQYTVFEKLKERLQRSRGSSAMTSLDFFLLGAVRYHHHTTRPLIHPSKLCATATTYPYIVVKSRMQLQVRAALLLTGL